MRDMHFDDILKQRLEAYEDHSPVEEAMLEQVLDTAGQLDPGLSWFAQFKVYLISGGLSAIALMGGLVYWLQSDVGIEADNAGESTSQIEWQIEAHDLDNQLESPPSSVPPKNTSNTIPANGNQEEIPLDIGVPPVQDLALADPDTLENFPEQEELDVQLYRPLNLIGLEVPNIFRPYTLSDRLPKTVESVPLPIIQDESSSINSFLLRNSDFPENSFFDPMAIPIPGIPEVGPGDPGRMGPGRPGRPRQRGRGRRP